MDKVDTNPCGLDGGAGLFSEYVRQRREQLASLLRHQLRGCAEFDLEVGSGHGHFLTAYADAHRDRTCIGIDISRDRFGRAERKRERSGLTNLRFAYCEAADFLACLPEHTIIARTFILFPDPWPKRRHHKNRVLNRSFLSALARRSGPAADLFFRTDHRPYFEEVVAALRSHQEWSAQAGSAWPFEEATVFQVRAPAFYSLSARRALPDRSGEIHPDDKKHLEHSREDQEREGEDVKRVHCQRPGT